MLSALEMAFIQYWERYISSVIITKSCISERHYQQLPSIQMQKLNHIRVRSATGSNLTPLGIIHCSFELGKIIFNNNLIVCRNLT